MAKRGGDDGALEKGKIRIFYAEVEGNNQSLQDVLKTVVTAMSRPGHTRIATNPQAALSTQTEQAVSGEEVAGDSEEVEAPELNGTPVRVRKRGQGPKADRNAGIKVVPDLNFRPNGKPALKDFFAEKTPKTDMEQTLALAYYMQHTLELPSFGPGHILTGFRDVGRPVPVDLKGTMRNMKNLKAWLNFTNIEESRVTTQGENEVEHEMGADRAA